MDANIIMDTDIIKERVAVVVAQHDELKKEAAFYTQFALAVHEVCRDPELGLANYVRDIRIDYNKGYQSLEFTAVGNGWEFKFLVEPLSDGKRFLVNTQAKGSPSSFNLGALYETNDGYANLTKAEIEGLRHVPGTFAVEAPLKNTLAVMIKNGLRLG